MHYNAFFRRRRKANDKHDQLFFAPLREKAAIGHNFLFPGKNLLILQVYRYNPQKFL
jgi:hypothetical protein